MSEPEVTTGPVHPESARYDGWTWRSRGGEPFERCTYCGSIKPEDLAALPGFLAEWADRKYGWPHKFYVDVPNPDTSAQFCTGSTNRRPFGDGWVPTEELTPEQHDILLRDGWSAADPGKAYLFGPRASFHAKFYTVHLSDPTVDPAVKERIETLSGLRFTFEDGKVAWGPVIHGV